jgi:hypothetical protein
LKSDDKNLMSQAVFNGEAYFYLSGKANMNNCRVWTRQNPRVSIGLKTDSVKLHVVFELSEQEVYGPFFFVENTIRSVIYLDVLQN